MQFKRIIYTCGIYNLNENDGRFSFFCHALRTIYANVFVWVYRVLCCYVIQSARKKRRRRRCHTICDVSFLFICPLSRATSVHCLLLGESYTQSHSRIRRFFFLNFQFTKITNKTQHTKKNNNNDDQFLFSPSLFRETDNALHIRSYLIRFSRDEHCITFECILRTQTKTQRCKSLTMCTRSTDPYFCIHRT